MGSSFSINFNKKIESLKNLAIYINGEIIIPNKFDLFPNLVSLTLDGRFGFSTFEEEPTSLSNLKHLSYLSIDGISLKNSKISLLLSCRAMCRHSISV